MQELKIINEQEVLGKDFKVYGDYENPLFKADDVANWLEHSNTSKMLSTIDEDEKIKATIDTLTNSYTALFLTEDGLYEVLMQSRKPIAKQFKKEVKNILKSIRKHGAYMTDNTLEQALTSPDFLIKLATELKSEREKRKALEVKAEQDKSKVLFADAVATAKTSILIGDLAKIIKQNGVEIGQKRLFEWLRINGYLMKSGTSFNMPTQMAMEKKLFEIKESTINNPDGSIRVTRTTKVTGVGQEYFVNKFLGTCNGQAVK